MGWACLGKPRWRWALNVWGYCYMCKERPRQVQPRPQQIAQHEALALDRPSQGEILHHFAGHGSVATNGSVGLAAEEQKRTRRKGQGISGIISALNWKTQSQQAGDDRLHQPPATGQRDPDGGGRSQDSAAPLSQQAISLGSTTNPTKGCKANAEQLLKQPIGCHHRSQATALHLLIKGGLRLGCDALKQPAESNVLERLKRCLTAAVVKAEIEPLSTHPDRISHHLQLDLLGKMMGEVVGSPSYHFKLLGRNHRKAAAAARRAVNSTAECRLW